MPDIAKDVIVAILGAAIALAGLLLVFSGFLFGQAASFPPTTDDAIIDRFRNAGRLGVVPFLLALGVAALSFSWMVHPSSCLYQPTLWSFGILILISALYGSIMLVGYL
jgi:hypothetical protein